MHLYFYFAFYIYFARLSYISQWENLDVAFDRDWLTWAIIENQ